LTFSYRLNVSVGFDGWVIETAKDALGHCLSDLEGSGRPEEGSSNANNGKQEHDNGEGLHDAILCALLLYCDERKNLREAT